MNKFYVYIATKGSDRYEFVEAESIAEFAKNEFNPATMSFSGIVIEAEDLDGALKTYTKPSCGLGEYMIADEPSATVIKKQVAHIQETYDNLITKLEVARCLLTMRLATSKLQEANALLNKIAEDLHNAYKNPKHVTPNLIFNTITSEALKKNIKYNAK